jgi:hypothetical protein
MKATLRWRSAFPESLDASSRAIVSALVYCASASWLLPVRAFSSPILNLLA